MDIILKEIVAIIKEETENINKKIYGTTFLEILKEKILNRQDQISLKNLVLQNSNIDLEENINVLEKNLFFKLSFYQNPKSLLKCELKKNYLIIVFREAVKIDIFNQNTQKYININLEEKINVLEKNLFFKLSLYQTPKSLLKFELKKNFLLIIFKEILKIDILNQKTQKYVNISLKPFMGLTLSKGTVCI